MKTCIHIALLFIISADVFAQQQTDAANIPAASSAGSILNVIFGLIVVLLVIYALAFGMKRFGAIPGKSNNIIRVISGLSVSQREKIVLVQVGEEQLLLGVSPGSVNLLHTLDKPVDENTVISHPQESNFSKKLSDVLRGDVKE